MDGGGGQGYKSAVIIISELNIKFYQCIILILKYLRLVNKPELDGGGVE